MVATACQVQAEVQVKIRHKDRSTASMVVEPEEWVSPEARVRMEAPVRQELTAERYFYRRQTLIKQLARSRSAQRVEKGAQGDGLVAVEMAVLEDQVVMAEDSVAAGRRAPLVREVLMGVTELRVSPALKEAWSNSGSTVGASGDSRPGAESFPHRRVHSTKRFGRPGA
jgi:hypothetical protein